MFTAAIRAALTSGGSTSKGEKLLQLCRRVLSSSSLTSRESQPEELEDHKWESPGIKQDVLNEDNPDPRDFLSYFVTHGEGFKTSLNAYNSSRVADQYDKSLLAVSYSGHQICADIVAGVTSQHPDRSQVKVIDVCAGTGVIGKALHQRGFRDLTAHDGAQAMVDFCQSTGAYNQFLCCALNDLGSLPFADSEFVSLLFSVPKPRTLSVSSAES
ncbi:uncharacterized protein LOC101845338 [Aplysia californica]|uniref:Uncharacterized protein LOC101845338 n=1 Tax=Aplysia californica TaxID=6500 RepID=A0ABM1VVH2_APLCA|nr:uncharacterized protein LOC101845338 [Aplysia californica]